MSSRLFQLCGPVIASALLAAVAGAQVVNDHCSGALPTGRGLVSGSNFGATIGPDPVNGCGLPGADVWFVWASTCNGAWTASTCSAGTDFDTILTVWDGSAGCGALVPLLCIDDFCGPPFSPTSSYVTFQSYAGSTYYFSVGGFAGAEGNFELSIDPVGPELHFFTDGPGSVGYTVDNGPPGGIVFTAITPNVAAYPYGWFNGIDIGMNELITQILVGYPFIATAGSVCGEVTVGPFYGLPSGLTFCGVSVGIPIGSPFPLPHYTSAPDSVYIL
jgi:hypothetical protein